MGKEKQLEYGSRLHDDIEMVLMSEAHDSESPFKQQQTYAMIPDRYKSRSSGSEQRVARN